MSEAELGFWALLALFGIVIVFVILIFMALMLGLLLFGNFPRKIK